MGVRSYGQTAQRVLLRANNDTLLPIDYTPSAPLINPIRRAPTLLVGSYYSMKKALSIFGYRRSPGLKHCKQASG